VLISLLCLLEHFPGNNDEPIRVSVFGPKILGRNKVYLLGLISSVAIRKDFNEVKFINIPTAEVAGTINELFLNLGYVIKSSVISEAAKLFVQSLQNKQSTEVLK
jgi:hypothetical protein